MALIKRQTSTTVPAPFSFAPAQTWDGNDGLWSTFIVRIGTPPQDFRVLPSTAGQETWVPDSEGCTKNDPSNCGNSRGVQPFNNQQGTGFLNNESSSWQSLGVYDLAFETNLDYENNVTYAGQGLFGFDTVGLQVENSNGITLNHQVVASIALKQFYLGIFGLGVKPANFSSFSDPQPAFLPSAVNQSLIPSRSWGYTAGASYRLQQVDGSLTLGGYDASRFEQSNVTFPFGPDDSRSLVVNVLSILAESTLSGTANMMSDTILSFIDSTVPEIWIPQAACDQFESHFGLQYDPQTDRYVVNDTIHSQLKTLNPTITFRLAIDSLGATFQDIILPYAAFDLQASYPIYENPTNYFPIRRAANSTQYTIGRTFLQEAYVIADYDRQQFSVNQASFPASGTLPPQHIVAIHPPGSGANNSSSNSGSSSGLSGGTIGGIVVGAVAAIAIVAALIFFLLRRKRRTNTSTQLDTYPADKPGDGQPNEDYFPPENKLPTGHGSELMSDARQEMPSPNPVYEADGTLKKPNAHEMSGQSSPRGHMPELYSETHPRAELEAGNKVARSVNPSDHFYELPGDDVSRSGGSPGASPRFGGSARGSLGFGISPGGSPHLSPGIGTQSSGTARSPSPLGLSARR
ncbi:MAG: hypothetical protein M1821_001983 [Bathelium mastoideum]|nr:MAG: hypothetical protein M1821_001983 [Bathelium mastoideum]KAI9692491.1 MAG: hypothetical protein M1822_006722 [Bathelium mastoideum]